MNRILFVTSECFPFVKTGGLADVCGALPKEFDPAEWDVRVVLPAYSCIPERYSKCFRLLAKLHVSCGPMLQDLEVGILTWDYQGITYYLIDNHTYFSGAAPYGMIRQDIEKFIFFQNAVLEMLPEVGFCPDIIHCHDWETSLIPVYLKEKYADLAFYQDIRSILTIHNMKFQGIWDIPTIQGLSGLPDELFTTEKMEFHGDANMLKGGLLYADHITTVSETYSEEIQTYSYGEGLNDVLASRHMSISGIINGIDGNFFNPADDPVLGCNYTADNFVAGKALNKVMLQNELGLTVDADRYMIGIVSRLTDQKGMDLINQTIEGIVDDYTQLVVIGTGPAIYENMFRNFAWRYPDRVSANISYNEALAHQLYAAADALLMPSAFEPCGLSQMIAFRYGTVPIVRETGGLKDTVTPFNEYENTGDGFSFYNYHGDDLLYIVNYSKQIYYDKRAAWNQMAARGMHNDFSWNASTKQYEALYRELIQK